MSVVCSELPGELKVVEFILGLQGGYTKYLCLWDGRADDQHYIGQEWGSRLGLKAGSHSVLSHPLVEPSKILLPPFHIKVSLMKNFVKALDKEVRGFAFLHQKFQQKSMEKLEAGIFDGPKQGNSSRTLALKMHCILLNSLPGCPLSKSLQTSLATTEVPSIRK